MATKIGGDQLRLEDFIKNPTPNEDWSSTLFTASLAAIKALMSASGIPELSGTIRLWEKEPGIYFLHGGTTIYIGASRASVESYDSILILSDFFQGYNYKYYIIYNTIGQITYGQARETGGTSIFSNITPFQGASELYQGGIGTVPAPQAGDNEKFLKGDGTWEKLPLMTGADWWPTLKDGEEGLAPKPTSNDVFKCLKGNGTWGHSNATFTCAINPTADEQGFYKFRIRMVDYTGNFRIYSETEISTIISEGYRCTLFVEQRRAYENTPIICYGAFKYQTGAYIPIFKHIDIISGKLTIGYYACEIEEGIEYWSYHQEM